MMDFIFKFDIIVNFFIAVPHAKKEYQFVLEISTIQTFYNCISVEIPSGKRFCCCQYYDQYFNTQIKLWWLQPLVPKTVNSLQTVLQSKFLLQEN